MTEFTDTSTATRVEKAKRVLRHLADGKDMAYFFEDGYPREKDLQNDARATLEVLEVLQTLLESGIGDLGSGGRVTWREQVRRGLGHNAI